MAVDFFKQNEDLIKSDPELMKLAQEVMGSEKDAKNSQGLFEKQDIEKLVKAYLDEDVPDDIKKTDLYKHFWAVLGKTIKLTFIESKDLAEFDSHFHIAKLGYIMSKPANEFTFKDQQILTQIRLYFLAAVKRAVGSPNHRVNERTMLASSINQRISSSTEVINAGQKRGFFNRFFG